MAEPPDRRPSGRSVAVGDEPSGATRALRRRWASAVGPLRPVLHRVLRLRPVRRAIGALARRQYERRRWAPALDRLAARADRFVFLRPDIRRESVDDVVELFFEIAELIDAAWFVEAGAKEAGASRRMAATLPAATVVAFEANPYTYRRFASELAETPVDYRNVALSDGADDVTFFVRRTAAGKPRADGQSSLLPRVDPEFGSEEVRVAATTIDAATATLPGRGAMWIDVEGANRQVLGGANRSLVETGLMLIEVEDDRLWVDQALSGSVIRGLRRSGLTPVARDRQSNRQHNVLLVGRTALADARVSAAIDSFRARDHQRFRTNGSR